MNDRANPFVPRPKAKDTVEVIDVRDDVLGDKFAFEGPPEPGFLPQTESRFGLTWPTQTIESWQGISVMGLHGGSGVSSVARLFGDSAQDVGQGWPIAKQNPYTGQQQPLKVVAVARDHYQGLQAANRFARVWAANGLPSSELVGLILVSASPRLSDARKKESRKVLRMVPTGGHIPWMDSWVEGPINTDHLPLRIKRTVKVFTQKSLTHKENS